MHRRKLRMLKFFSGFILILVILIFVSKTIKNDIALEMGILGTMYTFFYGLFINAIFKFLDEKYVHVRIFLGELIGKVQSIYNLALMTKNKKYILRTRKHLVEFMQTFNELKPERYFKNQHYIDKLYSDLGMVSVKTPKQTQEYSRLIQFIDHLSITREKLEIFGRKHLRGETKFIFISTTILYLIIIGALTFSHLNLYINIIGALLIFLVTFVVVLMFNLDNLSYGTYQIKNQNIEDIIQTIMQNK